MVHLIRNFRRPWAIAQGHPYAVELECDGMFCESVSLLSRVFARPDQMEEEIRRLRVDCRPEGWDSGTVEIPGSGPATVDFCPACRSASGAPWLQQRKGGNP